MSTLTALKLERELELARRALAGETARTKLVLQWSIDSATGRAVSRWVALRETVAPAVLVEPAFG
jgi:hypothetical protein